MHFKKTILLLFAVILFVPGISAQNKKTGNNERIVIDMHKLNSPRIEFGVEKLQKNLEQVGYKVTVNKDSAYSRGGKNISLVNAGKIFETYPEILSEYDRKHMPSKETFIIKSEINGNINIAGFW